MDGTLIALDISSVCVGYAVFENGELATYGRYRLKAKGHGEKLGKFRKWLTRLLRKHSPNELVIERSFPKGRISNTYRVLSMYEGAAIDAHFSVLNSELPKDNMMFAHEVKRIIGVQKGKDHSDNKQIMIKAINDMFGLSLRFSPKDVKKIRSQDDTADAIALGYAWIQKYYG